MSKSDDAVKEMQDVGALPPNFNTMIMSPWGSKSEDMFTLRFTSAGVPSELQFINYGATCTVEVGSQTYDVPASPGSPVTVPISGGPLIVIVTAKNVNVINPDMACLVINY